MEIKEQDILQTIQGEGAAIRSQMIEMPEAPVIVQETLLNSDEERAGIAVLTIIGYESLTGHIKKREFLIRRVIQNQNEYYLEGLAMDIHMPRLIRVKQISYIQENGTGKVYSNPYKFLQRVLGVDINDELFAEELSDFAKAIKETGNELTVLMYLVAVDGLRSATERKKVLAYVRRRVPYLDYDEEKMNDYLISLAPDDDCFSMAFHRILKKGIIVIQPLMETILEIILADGQVHVKERALLARLIDLLKQDGYQFQLPE